MNLFDLEELREARREMAARTMRVASVANIRELLDQLFDGRTSHPWFAAGQQILEECGDHPILRGELPEDHGFVFVPALRKGLWFKSGSSPGGIGPLPERAVEALEGIARDQHLL